MDVQYISYVNSQIGLIEIISNGIAVVSCGFVCCKKEGKTDKISEKGAIQIQEYLLGKRKVFDLPLEMEGTPFQRKVWQTLCSIPYGETRTYKEIAIQIGNEKACRAVGMANHKNPIGIIVPCHRVIGANKKLVGYAGGLDKKEFLLKLEKKNK